MFQAGLAWIRLERSLHHPPGRCEHLCRWCRFRTRDRSPSRNDRIVSTPPRTSQKTSLRLGPAEIRRCLPSPETGVARPLGTSPRGLVGEKLNKSLRTLSLVENHEIFITRPRQRLRTPVLGSCPARSPRRLATVVAKKGRSAGETQDPEGRRGGGPGSPSVKQSFLPLGA